MISEEAINENRGTSIFSAVSVVKPEKSMSKEVNLLPNTKSTEVHPTIEKQASEIKTYIVDDGFTLEELKETWEDDGNITSIKDWWPQIEQIAKRYKPELVKD